MKIYPVILSGGAGTRLWPLSRAAIPKQLLPLVSDKTMLQETALRLTGMPGLMPPLVVCGDEHRFLVAEQVRAIGLTALGILLEPVGRNTAPALAAAANHLLAIDPEAVMLALPADHVIKDVKAFETAIALAVRAAQDGGLATFGIVPTSPETGYGYIRRGAKRPGLENCYSVDSAILRRQWKLFLEQWYVPVPGNAIPWSIGHVRTSNRFCSRSCCPVKQA
jgi:mannose-1-phosphate guanylyltransferase/mannose-6-phosphate isomerase